MAHQNSFSPVRILQLLHRFMLTGQLIFLMIATGLIYFNQFTPVFTSAKEIGIIQLVVLFLVGIMLVAAHLYFKRKLAAIVLLETTANKIAAFRKALVLKLSLVQGSQFLTTVFFLITGKYELLVLSAVLVVLFIRNKPRKDQVAEQLQLSMTEAATL